MPAPGNTGSTWGTTWRLMRFTAAVDPGTFWFTVAAALAGSLAEGTGLVLLLPLLSVAGMNFGGSTAASRLSLETQRLLLRSGMAHGLWLPVVLGIFLAAAAVRSVLRRSQSTMVYSTTTKAELALSRRVYGAVVHAQWGFLVRQRSGRVTHLLTGELRRVADAISLSLSVINLSCLTVLYMVVALKLSAQMTLMVLLRRSLARMRSSGEELFESVAEMYAATEEHLLNMKSVKTYNAEDRDVQLYGDLCDKVGRRTVDHAKHQAAAAFRFEMGSLVALGVVIFLALGALHVQPAAMLLLLAVFTRLMPQLANLQSQTQQLASIVPAFDHVLAIEAECLKNAEAQTLEAEPATRTPLKLEAEFRLEGIWFAYQASFTAKDPKDVETGPEYVLRGIDLPIEAGSLTAVVGPSGAGKSTIADIVNGLLQPARGRLLLDGREFGMGELRQWRRQVGYVGQDTVLFHQSVRENLLWARPEATEDELREALLLASAGFVYDLPGGPESIVGDRGILLSSGQRQRISLARALLRKPTLLILDEATNALDVENEARVLDGLRQRMRSLGGSLTVLMIAHRASAIRRADRIFELEGGQVSRAGTWDELNFEMHL